MFDPATLEVSEGSDTSAIAIVVADSSVLLGDGFVSGEVGTHTHTQTEKERKREREKERERDILQSASYPQQPY